MMAREAVEAAGCRALYQIGQALVACWRLAGNSGKSSAHPLPTTARPDRSGPTAPIQSARRGDGCPAQWGRPQGCSLVPILSCCSADMWPLPLSLAGYQAVVH
jgi:hypothetical protein